MIQALYRLPSIAYDVITAVVQITPIRMPSLSFWQAGAFVGRIGRQVANLTGQPESRQLNLWVNGVIRTIPTIRI